MQNYLEKYQNFSQKSNSFVEIDIPEFTTLVFMDKVPCLFLAILAAVAISLAARAFFNCTAGGRENQII